ncbi:peroxiredoxin-5, mitochondrial isoform X2 [Nematostella vectensis]|nr:peroxiredoxin-5, mitochondrial isoform X2 [Nematostella vectensis]
MRDKIDLQHVSFLFGVGRFRSARRSSTRDLMLRTASVRFARGFRTATFAAMPIKVGEALPSIKVMEGTPKDTVDVASLFKGKKGILFAVPGAFTPGCSKTHLPGYVADFDKIKSKGVDVVACIAVNDPFVMSAWGEANGCQGKIQMLADVHGEFTKAVDLELDATPFLGNIRSKR